MRRQRLFDNGLIERPLNALLQHGFRDAAFSVQFGGDLCLSAVAPGVELLGEADDA